MSVIWRKSLAEDLLNTASLRCCLYEYVDGCLHQLRRDIFEMLKKEVDVSNSDKSLLSWLSSSKAMEVIPDGLNEPRITRTVSQNENLMAILEQN